jgi:hypothetical protein
MILAIQSKGVKYSNIRRLDSNISRIRTEVLTGRTGRPIMLVEVLAGPLVKADRKHQTNNIGGRAT